MGELVYQSCNPKDANNGAQKAKALIESMRWFCRSVELCNDYLRGYYGLKVVGALFHAREETSTDRMKLCLLR